MKDNLAFFTHDQDAHNHPKMRALRSKYGNAGYGAFWVLNEIIASAPLGRLDISRSIYRMACADDLRMTPEEFDGFVAFLTSEDIRLATLDEGALTTDRVQEDLGRAMPERLKARERYQKREGYKTSPENVETSPEESKTSPEVLYRVDKSREEEKREEETQKSVRVEGPKVLVSWYRRHQTETSRLVSPSDDDRRLSLDLQARYLAPDLERALTEYWDRWREHWFSVQKGDSKKPASQRRPFFLFSSFARHIEELLQPESIPEDGADLVDF